MGYMRRGHGDEVLAGVEEEEKACHSPWALRAIVKVVSQGHCAALWAPPIPSCTSPGSFIPIKSVNVTHWSLTWQTVRDTMIQDLNYIAQH